MVEALSNSPDTAQPPPANGWRKRRDEAGLTTLEWLLIVAAVAGLAALAVVLVTNVVGETSEQISGSSARKTGAEVAAQTLVDASKTVDATDVATGGRFDSWAKWQNYFTSRCNRIKITFDDAVASATPTFSQNGHTASAPTVAALAGAGNATAANGTVRASCVIQ